MTEDGEKELIEVLARIATALEMANFIKSFPQQPGAVGGNGYQCSRCFQWVSPGTMHACAGGFGGSTAGSYSVCSAIGGNGGTCYLQKGHTSEHVFAVVTN